MKKIKAAENASRYLNKYFSERSWKDSEESAESGVSVLGGAGGGQEGYLYSLCEPLGEPHSQSTSPLRKQTFLLFVLELSLASVNKFLQFYTPSSGKVQSLGNRLVGGQILTSPTGCVRSGGGCGEPCSSGTQLHHHHFHRHSPPQPPHSQLEHPNQCLSWVRTHTRVLSLTVATLSGLHLRCVAFSWEHSTLS